MDTKIVTLLAVFLCLFSQSWSGSTVGMNGEEGRRLTCEQSNGRSSKIIGFGTGILCASFIRTLDIIVSNKLSPDVSHHFLIAAFLLSIGYRKTILSMLKKNCFLFRDSNMVAVCVSFILYFKRDQKIGNNTRYAGCYTTSGYRNYA